MKTEQKKKEKKEKTLAHKIVMGINLMTISLLMALGVMVFFREKSVNDVQFTENLGNIMRLTDTTLSAFLNGSNSELSLLGGTYLMAKNDPDTMEERIIEYESAYVENTDLVLAASITLEESGQCFYYPQDYAPENAQEEGWYIEAVDYDGTPRFSTLHELSDGTLAFTASKTIMDEYGDMVGVAAYEIDARMFGILLGDSTSMGDIKYLLIDQDCNVLLNPFSDELVLQKVNDIGIKSVEHYAPGAYRISREKIFDGTNCEMRILPRPMPIYCRWRMILLNWRTSNY